EEDRLFFAFRVSVIEVVETRFNGVDAIIRLLNALICRVCFPICSLSGLRRRIGSFLSRNGFLIGSCGIGYTLLSPLFNGINALGILLHAVLGFLNCWFESLRLKSHIFTGCAP